MASRIYDFTLGASVGATQRLDVMAARVKIISSVYAVEVRTDTGDVYSLLAGQGFSLPAGQTFREVVLRNTVAIAQAGVVFIGDESFEDSRVTGDVTVIDASASKTNLGKQFFASDANNANAVAYCLICLNANGARAAVKRLLIYSSVAGTVTMGSYTSAGTATPLAGSLVNMLFGGAASTVKSGASITAAATPTAGEVPGYLQFLRVYVQANQTLEINLQDAPFVISGTVGLAILGQALNRDLGVGFRVEEL